MNLHKIKIRFNQALMLMIVFFCLFTTLIQGTFLSSAIPANVILIGCSLAALGVWLSIWYFYKKEKLTEEKVVFAIIFSGMLFHCCYVLLSGLYERQHDEGVYTGIATKQINPGHIGYIEYIYKFRKLPDMNPYELFSYYHPPLHYAISGLWLILLTSLGIAEDLAFENLQVLPLFYSGMLMLLTYWILKRTGAKGKAVYAGLLLVSLHPALTIMSGSINNDMLSTLLLACCIFSTLCFIQERSLKNLLWMALSIGFGMLCKINTAVMAFPIGLVLLMDFMEKIRSKDKKVIFRCIRNDLLFGLTAGAVGLVWIARNLIRFHVKPGISSATEASVMYTGNYGIWARVGIPSFADWHFDFPFHPLSGDVIHNTWVIMFQTSLFTEVYPAEIDGISLMLCRIAYVMAIFAAVCSAVLFCITQFQKTKSGGQKNVCEAVFFLAGYLTFLASFVVFALKYPYTCSSDFRYIVICLVYIAVGLADSGRIAPDKTKAAATFRIIRILVCVTLILTTIIYMTWQQWGSMMT